MVAVCTLGFVFWVSAERVGSGVEVSRNKALNLIRFFQPNFLYFCELVHLH